jgi:3-phenylpropionate/trans-cinnamate dioxygenase ferredoxin reductase subunit
MLEMHTVTINGEEYFARTGDILLDLALLNGVDIPHDCRSGQCGTCRVNVRSGCVFEEGQFGTGVVHACRSRIVADVAIGFEAIPTTETIDGQVAAVTPLAPNVLEVQVEPARPLRYLPGQYLQVQFRDFPQRPFSPTAALDQDFDDGLVRFHIRRFSGGLVSSALGRSIDVGHPLKLTGPFGSAYLRAGRSNRLVLIAGGTGFAPIWSIADAALREDRHRSVMAVVGALSLEALYMIPALCRMAAFPHVELIPVTELNQSITSVIRTGRPTDFLPSLSPDDIVHVAGPPALVDAVKQAAAERHATCHADAFVATAEDGSWVARAFARALGDFSALFAPKESSRAGGDTGEPAPSPSKPRVMAQRMETHSNS